MIRVRLAGVAAVVAVTALLGATGMLLAQSAGGLVASAELPDMPLGAFHNSLYRYPADHITDDHGVRMGSLGSDIFQGDSPNEFWAVTDRGPNGNPGRRTFVAPAFNPLIMYVRTQGTGVQILRALPITDDSGAPVTGLPNVPVFDETPWNYNGTQLIPGNPNGLDTEGIVRTRAGDFWLVDEYSPSLVHVGPDGRVIDRFVPVDSLLGMTVATTPNYRVRKYLPRILNFRRQNRGFEGIAITPDEKTLFLAMQSPLDYPTAALGRASRNVRIIRFDIGSEQVTGEFVYQFDEVCAFLRQPTGCAVPPGEMKISGLSAISATEFLVDERTDQVAKIYRVTTSGATNILGSVWGTVAASPGASTPALETLANPAAQGVAVTPKSLVLDLSPFGLPDKIEGIALVRPDLLAVANDNDFGMTDNATFNSAGRITSDTRVRSRIFYFQLPGSVSR